MTSKWIDVIFKMQVQLLIFLWDLIKGGFLWASGKFNARVITASFPATNLKLTCSLDSIGIAINWELPLNIDLHLALREMSYAMLGIKRWKTWVKCHMQIKLLMMMFEWIVAPFVSYTLQVYGITQNKSCKMFTHTLPFTHSGHQLA